MISLAPCPACLHPNYLEAGALSLHASLMHQPPGQALELLQLDGRPRSTTPRLVTSLPWPDPDRRDDDLVVAGG